MFKWLARLLGWGDKPESSREESRTRTTSLPVPVAVSPRIFLGWKELIDAQARIAGYLLEIRTADGSQPDGAELVAALVREGVVRFAERRPLIVPVTPTQWATADISVLRAAETVFLLDARREDQATLAANSRSLGLRFAVDVRVGQQLADIAPDYVFLDFGGQPVNQLEELIPQIRASGATVIATGIQSWAEHRLALSLGCRYSQGAFATTRDESQEQEALGRNRLTVLEMLNQLRAGAEIEVLAGLAKRDPAIVVQLLQMANSPAAGLSQPVNSLESAMLLLGRDALYRWLAVTLFRVDGEGGRDRTLLVLALGRAFFLETLFRKTDAALAGSLFLLGLLSVVDALFGLPMDKALASLSLPDPVREALVHGEGPYARYLALAMAMERCQLPRAVSVAAVLGVSVDDLIGSYASALAAATGELN